MPTYTDNLKLPLLEAIQAQPEVVHNEVLHTLDGLVQCSVRDRDLSAVPGTLTLGDMYIVAASPTGAWAGHAKHLAHYTSGGWRFYIPEDGWMAWVRDEGILVVYDADGAAWVPLTAGGGGGAGSGSGEAQVTLSGSNVTLTSTEVSGIFVLRLTGTLTADIDLMLPALSRSYVVLNQTVGNFAITVKAGGSETVVLTGGEQVLLYCDGSDVYLIGGTPAGGGSAEAVSAQYDVQLFFGGTLGAGELLYAKRVVRALTFRAALPGSRAGSVVASTGSATINLYRDGALIGSVNFGAAATEATFSFASDVTFNPGQVLSLVAPSPADGTLAGVDITLVADRGPVANIYDMAFFFPSKPGDGATLIAKRLVRQVTFPAALAGSRGGAVTATTATKVFSLRKNGTQFATFTINAAGTEGAFAAASQTVFQAGDVFSIVAPTPQDATLAGVDITITGSTA